MKFHTHKADCCENETDSIKSFYRKYSELLNVKLGYKTMTAELQTVNIHLIQNLYIYIYNHILSSV
jgi:hypothetical protein